MLMIIECQEDFIVALYQDLHKERTEALYSELCLVKNEIIKFKKELKSWMAREQVSTPAVLSPSFCEILSVPLSSPACLIIGPFNYPVLIPLLVLVGALGGGNPAVLKPSEMCKNVSATFSRLIPKYFEKGAVQVVEGGAEETSELMKYNWGMVHFTGSERVGKIIQTNAAKTLSPTILELGGKSPAIVAEDCPEDIDTVCNRIVSGKLMNCGQTCVAPDYILCHESKISLLSKNIIMAIERLYGTDQKDSELPRIVDENNAKRLVAMIAEVENEKNSSTKILYGGSVACSVKEKYIVPTVILNPPPGSRVMIEEIFGPILPIAVYRTDEEAISFSQKICRTPLTMYVFTKSKQRYEKYMARIPSGSAMRNDTLLQFAIPDFPFGGIGTSGIGKYQGKASFDAFTHKKTSQYHPCLSLLDAYGLRYHPHGGGRGKIFLAALKYSPNIPVLSLSMKILLLTSILILVGPKIVVISIAQALEIVASLLRSYSSD